MWLVGVDFGICPLREVWHDRLLYYFILNYQVARQVAFGMYEMLRNNAANIHETDDWDVVFAVIEIVGAGASPDDQVIFSLLDR